MKLPKENNPKVIPKPNTKENKKKKQETKQIKKIESPSVQEKNVVKDFFLKRLMHIEQINKELEDAKLELEIKLKNICDELTLAKDESKKQTEELNEQLIQKDELINQLNHAKNCLNTKAQKLMNELKIQGTEIQDTLNKYSEELSKKNKKIEFLNQELMRKQQEFENKTQQLQLEIEKAKNDHKNELYQVVKDLTERENIMKQLLEKTTNELRIKDQYLNTYKSNLEHSNKQYEELLKQMETLKKCTAQEMEQLKFKLNENENLISNIENLLKIRDEECLNLKNRISMNNENEKIIKDITYENKILKQENLQYKQTIERKDNKLIQLEKDLQTIKEELEKTTQSLAAVNKEHDVAKITIYKLKQTNEELTNKYKSSIEQLEVIDNHNKTITELNDQYEKEIQYLKSEIITYQDIINNLQKKVAEATESREKMEKAFRDRCLKIKEKRKRPQPKISSLKRLMQSPQTPSPPSKKQKRTTPFSASPAKIDYRNVKSRYLQIPSLNSPVRTVYSSNSEILGYVGFTN